MKGPHRSASRLPPFFGIKPIYYDFGLVVVGACGTCFGGGAGFGVFTPIFRKPPREPKPAI
mgnify:CR=1 FL=1